MTRRFRAFPARLLRDSAGSVLAYAAVAAPVHIGAAALSVDIGPWHATKRLAQSAADSATLAGALEIVGSGGDATQISAIVLSDAAINGLTTGRRAAITVNYPPSSGPNVGSTVAVEVIVARPGHRLPSPVLFSGDTNIVARTVATADINNSCVWALYPSSPSSFRVTGGSEMELSGVR